MNDSELISEIARMWVYHGGTEDKFRANSWIIRDQIHRIEQDEQYTEDSDV